MRESKRKKLEAKGWKIGSPKDFLGMSDEEEAYVNLRLKARRGFEGTTSSSRHHSSGSGAGDQVQPVARREDGIRRPDGVARLTRKIAAGPRYIKPRIGDNHYPVVTVVSLQDTTT